jgi:hypothetical protein
LLPWLPHPKVARGRLSGMARVVAPFVASGIADYQGDPLGRAIQALCPPRSAKPTAMV